MGTIKLKSFDRAMDFIIASVILVVTSLLLYLLFKEIKRQQKIKGYHYSKRNKKSKAHSKHWSKKGLDQKLLTMLGGDKKTALRLLDNVHRNNPAKSYVWCQEKVLRDLERDRR